jgi:hypothetical protein
LGEYVQQDLFLQFSKEQELWMVGVGDQVNLVFSCGSTMVDELVRE